MTDNLKILSIADLEEAASRVLPKPTKGMI
jgi:hypothetical protein